LRKYQLHSPNSSERKEEEFLRVVHLELGNRWQIKKAKEFVSISVTKDRAGKMSIAAAANSCLC
jgi:hypothetical protein